MQAGDGARAASAFHAPGGEVPALGPKFFIFKQKPMPEGFIIMALIAMLLILAVAAQGVIWVLSQQAQRAREQDLLKVGRLYAQAIASYYESSPGRVKQWPTQLEELLADRRFVYTHRYLRELYPDPVARGRDWVLLKTYSGGICGVRSRSTEAPIIEAAVDVPLFISAEPMRQEAQVLRLAPASHYADWRFIYVPSNSVEADGTAQECS